MKLISAPRTWTIREFMCVPLTTMEVAPAISMIAIFTAIAYGLLNLIYWAFSIDASQYVLAVIAFVIALALYAGVCSVFYWLLGRYRTDA